MLGNKVAEAIQTILPKADQYQLHEPYFTGNEWQYVKECIDTRWVSSVGSYVDRFEQQLALATGARYAIVTVNGTAALHIALMLAGVVAGDEVLIPALTFVGTANAVSYCGATAHFVDSDRQTLGVCPEKLEAYLQEVAEVKSDVCINRQTGKPIRALCVVHIFGHPAKMDALVALCKRYHIALVEDAAEALGSYYQGQHVGHFGAFGALSFNGNKVITTGGGGAIITDDVELAKQAKHITTTAKRSHAWDFIHDATAYNYRMPNINAALGCAQLENLSTFLSHKKKLATAYKKIFSNIEGVTFLEQPQNATSNYWLNALLLDSVDVDLRDAVLATLHQHKIFARPVWTLMPQLSMYAHCPRMDLTVANALSQQIINIPSSVFLGESL